MQDYQSFLNRLQKRGSKPHKISHCLGARDAWKWVRRNKWEALDGNPCSQSLYGCIIDTVNEILAEHLIDGHEIELPCRMGSIYLASVPAKVAWEGDELKTNYRTDWLKTLRLYYEDEEARSAHKTVKRVQRDIVFIKYDRTKANYTNKRFYVFRANRSLVRRVGEALEDGRAKAMNLKSD